MASPCDVYPLAINVSVQSPPLAIRMDFATAELKTMAQRVAGPPRHEALGFYKDSVSYRFMVRIRAGGVRSCLALSVDAQLVVVDRVSEIGRDLQSDPCLLRAAVGHYKRHAAASAAALSNVAATLPEALRTEVILEVSARSGNNDEIKGYVEGRVKAVLDNALVSLSRHAAILQDRVDTPLEVKAFDRSCDMF